MAQWLAWYTPKYITPQTTGTYFNNGSYGKIPVFCTNVAALGADRNLGDFPSLRNFFLDNWAVDIEKLKIPSLHGYASSFDHDLAYATPEGGWRRQHCEFFDCTDYFHDCLVTTPNYRNKLAIQLNDEYAYEFIEFISNTWQPYRRIFRCLSSGATQEVNWGGMARSPIACYQQTKRANYSLVEGQMPMLLFLNPEDPDTPTHSATIVWSATEGGPSSGARSANICGFQELRTPTASIYSINPASVGGRYWVDGSDPYGNIIPENEAEGGESTGTGITPSEPVPEPDPLIVSSADTGFTRIYNPSLSQLQDFAHYMWTDTNIFQTVWNHVKQYFEDPMDAFIALNILPVSIPSSGSEEVRLLFINTGKYMNVASNQFVTVELGELTLNEAYGSALDYAPNTQIDLFLPYIGTVSVDADEVMGRRVKLTYKVDICTGVCVAILKVELDIEGGKAFFPLYQFTGNCAIRIPFTAANMDGYINAALNAAKIAAVAAGAGLASMAAGAGTAEMTTTSAANAGTSLSTEVASHAPITPATLAAGFPALRLGDAVRNASQNASLFNAAATCMKHVPSAIGIRASMKPRFEKSSGFVGNSGYMSYKVPFFIMKVPRMVNPGEYGKYNGYPSLSYQMFSVLNGYAEIQQVQLTNINATANELDEIQSMLKSGVIF